MRPEIPAQKVVVSPPKTLLIDPTSFGGGNATGELKISYFKGFGEAFLLHLCAGTNGRLRLARGGVFASSSGSVEADSQSLVDQCRSFGPELILYRPVPDPPEFHRAAMRLIRELGRPWIVWVMDDWVERLRAQDPARFERMDRDLRELLRGASQRFAISEDMAEAFSERYGGSFAIFRNGVLQQDWVHVKRHPPRGEVKIRYAGALAPDMGNESVLAVANIVEQLAPSLRVSLDIRTQGHWYRDEKHKYEGFKHVDISTSDLSPADYRQWLADAHILLIAYNFDPETVRYVRYSFGNKVPECLASGAAVLAYGPKDIATIKFLANSDAAVVVGTPDPVALRQAVESLVKDRKSRARLGERGRTLALSRLELNRQRQKFAAELRAAAGLPAVPLDMIQFWRDEPPPAPKAASAAGVQRRAGPRSRIDWMRASTLWADWTRPMRRRPIVSAFVAVALVTLLTFPFGRSFLSALVSPELITALLIANFVLVAIVARIVRKSLISRISELATRTEEDLRRSEARQLSSIKSQLSGLERRLTASLRPPAPVSVPDSEELASKIAARLAEVQRAEQQPATAVDEQPAVAEPAAPADVQAAHGNGTNGGPDSHYAESSPADDNETAEVDPRTAHENRTAPRPDFA